MDWKIELIAVPVADLDRAKAFYVEKFGFNADTDVTVNENLRFIQLTPPGSACSIVLDKNMTEMTAGSVKGLQVVVADIERAQKELQDRGVDTGKIDEQPWGKFLYFADPDGNEWAIQQIPPRATS